MPKVQFIALVVSAFALSACEMRHKTHEPAPPKIPSWQISLAPVVKTPTSEADLNRYQVSIAIPEAAGKTVSIFRNDERLSDVAPGSVWIDSRVEPGKTYRYQARTDVVKYEGDVSIPKDLYVNGCVETRTISDKKLGRLFLTDSAVLATQGEAFDLEVDELISRPDAKLTILCENGSTVPGNSGLVSLHAGRAQGFLNIDAYYDNAKVFPGLTPNEESYLSKMGSQKIQFTIRERSPFKIETTHHSVPEGVDLWLRPITFHNGRTETLCGRTMLPAAQVSGIYLYRRPEHKEETLLKFVSPDGENALIYNEPSVYGTTFFNLGAYGSSPNVNCEIRSTDFTFLGVRPVDKDKKRFTDVEDTLIKPLPPDSSEVPAYVLPVIKLMNAVIQLNEKFAADGIVVGLNAGRFHTLVSFDSEKQLGLITLLEKQPDSLRTRLRAKGIRQIYFSPETTFTIEKRDNVLFIPAHLSLSAAEALQQILNLP